MLGLLAFLQTLGHRRLIVLLEQVIIEIERRLVIAGYQLVFLLHGRAGLHPALIQTDLLLNIRLLLRPFLNHLIVLVDLRAQLLDLGWLGRLSDCFFRRRIFLLLLAVRNLELQRGDIVLRLDDVGMVVRVFGLKRE